MSFFQFHAPAFLALLGLLPVVAWWVGRMGPEAAVRFSNTGLLRSLGLPRRSRAGRFLFGLRLLALAAFITALARPQFVESHDTTEAEGIDIVSILDMSGSMRALDLSSDDDVVTRLDAAKRVLEDFVDKREYDRIGMVAFAADAYVVSPLTLNHDWLKRNLERLELGGIDGSATAIGTALSAGIDRLRDHPSRSRIAILLTDGENNAGSISPMSAAELAESFDIKVYTIATGRTGRVPVPSMTRDGRILRDKNGRPVYHGRSSMSQYDESELREIAELTGGRFYKATESGDLERIYAEIDELETSVVELSSWSTYTELFHWPALFGLACLALEQMLRNTRYRRMP